MINLYSAAHEYVTKHASIHLLQSASLEGFGVSLWWREEYGDIHITVLMYTAPQKKHASRPAISCTDAEESSGTFWVTHPVSCPHESPAASPQSSAPPRLPLHGLTATAVSLQSVRHFCYTG